MVRRKKCSLFLGQKGWLPIAKLKPLLSICRFSCFWLLSISCATRESSSCPETEKQKVSRNFIQQVGAASQFLLSPAFGDESTMWVVIEPSSWVLSFADQFSNFTSRLFIKPCPLVFHRPPACLRRPFTSFTICLCCCSCSSCRFPPASLGSCSSTMQWRDRF